MSDAPIPVGSHPYGGFTQVSANGPYRFEWTPFTPAIVAWRNAERALQHARDRLAEASTIRGFAIAGLEPDHQRFVEAMKVLATDVDDAAREAGKVAAGLDAANASYAKANEASRVEYQQLCAAIDARLVAQGR